MNLLDIDDKIERNEKYLEFYYSNYQKTQSKITVLTLIYSVISIYTVQIIKYPFDQTSINPGQILFIILLLAFLILLGISIFNTYQLLYPEEVAYMNFPKVFYSDIRLQYEEILDDPDENTLNEYVKATYLNELETAIGTNSKLYKTKSRFYYLAFRYSLASLIVYLICSGFVVFNGKKKVSSTDVANFKEIIDYADSINFRNKELIHMSDSNKHQGNSENTNKPEVDTSKIIITKPQMIRENFSAKESRSSRSQNTQEQGSSEKKGD